MQLEANMVSTKGVSLYSAMLVLLCALAGLLGIAEARSEQVLQAKYSARRRSPFAWRKRRCAKRWQFCRGRYRHSRRACCANSADECTRVNASFSVCFPKHKPRASCNGSCCRCQCYCVILAATSALRRWPLPSTSESRP